MRRRDRQAGPWLWDRAYLVAWTTCISVAVEYFSRSELRGTLGWGYHHLPAFLINLIFIGLALYGLGVLTSSPRLAYAVVSLMLLVPALISGIKLRLIGLPLLPTDFNLFNEARDVIRLKDIIHTGSLIVLTLFLIASAALLYAMPKRPWSFRFKERMALSLGAFGLIAACYSALPVAGRVGLMDNSLVWDQAENVRQHGFTLSALLNLRTLASRQPKAVARTLDRFTPPQPPDPGAQEPGNAQAEPVIRQDQKPNIIIVLSESLWDLTQLKQVTFSQDPLPFLHSLQGRYPSGTMLSPEFGGQTANVEFEVLTSLSMRFLRQGTVPYMHLMKNEVDSLASILARQGYASTMISPWPNAFFNSNNAYRFMGFSRFISEEFFRPVRSGPYIADAEVARMIMQETQRTAGPDFIFANTAENHEPFDADKFPVNTIKVQGLSGEPKDLLQTYAQGAWQADQMLKTLVEHYSQRNEPTIIAFFGDHLPILGESYLTYRSANYISGTNDADFLNKMYRVPVLVWDNYLPTDHDVLNMSPSFLGPYVLGRVSLPGTPFTDYVREIAKKTPVIPPRNRWPAIGIADGELDEYEALQQDVLYGDRVAYGEARGKIIDPNFVAGFGPVRVNRVTAEVDSNGATTLIVEGSNFPPLAWVYMGDTPIGTTWVNEGLMRAKAPPELLNVGARQAQVRVLDPWQAAAVVKSNTVTFTLP